MGSNAILVFSRVKFAVMKVPEEQEISWHVAGEYHEGIVIYVRKEG